MRLSFCFLGLVLLLAASFTVSQSSKKADEPLDTGDLFLLTDDSFKIHLTDDIPLAIVFFYAPWCSYSKSFLPVFAGLNEQFEGNFKELKDKRARARETHYFHA